MIQISDINALSSIGDELASLVNIQSENWNDVVYERIHKDMIDPIDSRMRQTASSAESCIQRVVSIYNDMSLIAGKY